MPFKTLKSVLASPVTGAVKVAVMSKGPVTVPEEVVRLTPGALRPLTVQVMAWVTVFQPSVMPRLVV